LFSAIHVDGKRLYELARAGNVTVEVKPRPVQIESVALVEESLPNIVVRIECSSGTYVRSIARDLGEALGVGGCMTSLIRERSGAFDLSTAHTIEKLKDDQTVAEDCLLDPLLVLQENKSLAHCQVDKQTAVNVMHGKIISAESFNLQTAAPESFVLISHENKLLAVCTLSENHLKPEVVLANAVTETR
jgi:tRNA pseudouridine55 synthase